MEWASWPDPLAVTLVFGGTMAAAFLRCGWRNAAETLRVVCSLWAPPFATSRVKAELAAQIWQIGENGLLRAEPHQFTDDEFSAVASALIRHHSVTALRKEHEKHRRRRRASAETSITVLSEAAELAPVLGLAGTLLALVGLPAATAEGVDYGPAIGTAVTTTLYGLILANFILAPLAAAVARRSQAEDKARQELLNWLAESLVRTMASSSTTDARNHVG